MKKTTYAGTTSTGETFKRQSARVYTHAVVAIRPADGKIANLGVAFCGNLELARKMLRKGVDGYWPGMCEIVEVHEI